MRHETELDISITAAVKTDQWSTNPLLRLVVMRGASNELVVLQGKCRRPIGELGPPRSSHRPAVLSKTGLLAWAVDIVAAIHSFARSLPDLAFMGRCKVTSKSYRPTPVDDWRLG
jgi:hypothetical protein